jgi:hypothetical protein
LVLGQLRPVSRLSRISRAPALSLARERELQVLSSSIPKLLCFWQILSDFENSFFSYICSIQYNKIKPVAGGGGRGDGVRPSVPPHFEISWGKNLCFFI